MHILLVDDEPDIRTIGELSLGQVGGHEVSLASDGAHALERVRALAPAVILLDMSMPGMDGLEVLRRLKADPGTAEIPVIFMTAKVQRSDIDRYRAAGALGVIPKPFDPMTLSAQVEELLDRRDG